MKRLFAAVALAMLFASSVTCSFAASSGDVLAALSAQISVVCPIDGISLGKVADKSTWRIDFSKSATPAQRAAAASVVSSFNPATVLAPDGIDLMDEILLKIAFNHENRLRALEGKAAVTVNQFKAALRALP